MYEDGPRGHKEAGTGRVEGQGADDTRELGSQQTGGDRGTRTGAVVRGSGSVRHQRGRSGPGRTLVS